jgi:hypothetical protein
MCATCHNPIVPFQYPGVKVRLARREFWPNWTKQHDYMTGTGMIVWGGVDTSSNLNWLKTYMPVIVKSN